MSRILFVQADGGGSVPPAIAVARRLREQGHAVRFLASRSLAGRLAGEDLPHEPFATSADFDPSRRETDQLRDWAAWTPLGAVHALYRWMCGTASVQAAEVVASVAATPTDVIVADFMLMGAFIATEALGLPSVGLVHTVGVLPLDGVPPIGFGLRPARGPMGRWRDHVLQQAQNRLLRRWLVALNAARGAHGLPPLATIHEQWLRAQRLLILSSRAFDFPATRVPPHVRYVGPAFWEAPVQTPLDLPGSETRPLVLGSLSTTYQAAELYLRTLVAGLGMLPVQGLVTTGAGYEPASLAPVPGNVTVCAYVPHAAALSRAAAVVTHGGHGTVIKALAHGVPMVCVPFGRDQADVACRAVATGAAIALRPSLLTARRLARALEQVLENPRYRNAARRMQEALEHEDGATNAAAEIVALT